MRDPIIAPDCAGSHLQSVRESRSHPPGSHLLAVPESRTDCPTNLSSRSDPSEQPVSSGSPPVVHRGRRNERHLDDAAATPGRHASAPSWQGRCVRHDPLHHRSAWQESGARACVDVRRWMVVVGVIEPPAEFRCQDLANGRLARSGYAHEDHDLSLCLLTLASLLMP
jgi:hypothetical protein